MLLRGGLEQHMASENTQAVKAQFKPSNHHSEPSVTRTTRELFAFLNRPWRPLGRSIFQNRRRPHIEPAKSTSPVEEIVEHVTDGDLTLDRILANCKVTLESRYGTINIAGRIGEGVQATLKAAKGVRIQEGIGPHSIVQIQSGGDVLICHAIAERARVTITSAAPEIDPITQTYRSESELTPGSVVQIDGDVGQNSSAKITAQWDVTIAGTISEEANLDVISLRGTVSIGTMNQNRVVAVVTAGKSIHLLDNLGPRSKLTAMAHDDVTIGGKIEQAGEAKITSIAGSITIGQGLANEANARLAASNGRITIGGAVERGAAVAWKALEFSCSRQEGTIRRVP